MTAAPALTVHSVRPLVPGEVCADHVVLTYDDRLIRRKRLICASGRAVMVDLPQTVSLDEASVLAAEEGALIGVVAADEDLLAVTGPVTQLAWHIGNRHTPCEITEDRIVIRAERVMAEMLAGLGATVTPFRGPFRPGGGAYGRGRTMGHSHEVGHEAGHGAGAGPAYDPAEGQPHSHDHPHAHSHGHPHGPDHDHDHDRGHPHSHDQGADHRHGDHGHEH